LRIREYREEERGALARLSALSFGEEVARWEAYYDPEKNARIDPGSVYVVEEDGGLRATATVLPLEAYVDGRAVAVGGISAVNAHPAYRRRGHAGALMRAVLGAMREKRVHLSTLWPFAHAFYRAYGWELSGESIEYELRPTDLPTSVEQWKVRAYGEEDLPRLADLFAQEASRHQLAVMRSEGHWRSWLGRDGNEAVVYERNGVIEGYTLYSMSDWRDREEPRRRLRVREIVSESAGAWEGLISFAAAQDPLVFGIEVSAPPGEPIHPYLRSSHVEAKVHPEFMLRLVHVEGALGHLKREIEEPLVLEVADDVIPENTGEYTVASGEVLRGADARERVFLDVRQLAQLYAGYLPARDLARHGLIRPGSAEALELLEAHFPVDDPWVYPVDHF
jgi:predicted acetyltransferase